MPTQSYRRKQNPVNEKVRSDTLPVRPNPKALRQPTGLASCPMVNVTGVLVDEVKPLVSLPQQSNDYGTLFNDPQRVHEWCVASANGPAHVVDDLLPGHRSMSHSNNVCGDPRFSYQLGYPCGVQPSANLSDLSTKQLFPARATARALPDDRCNDYPEFTTSLLTGVMLPLEPFYVIDGPLGGECLPRDIWATDDGQIPGPLNVPAMGFPTPGDIYQEPSSAILDQYPLEAIWPTAQCHGGDSSPDCPSLYPSDSTWSAPSAVAMDPSLSSSCSQDSYVLHQAGSPTSFTSQEDLKYIISGEDCGISPLTMDGISSVPYAYGMYHNSLDTARFV
ncbi:hypothetical protein MMC19_004410 [Ptychographa xylographoides]|nr:hypothetical protein [Ptychographa xylographoides]